MTVFVIVDVSVSVNKMHSFLRVTAPRLIESRKGLDAHLPYITPSMTNSCAARLMAMLLCYDLLQRSILLGGGQVAGFILLSFFNGVRGSAMGGWADFRTYSHTR